MSDPLRTLLGEAEAAGITLHSLEVSISGRTVIRSGIAPFGPDVPHRLYSVSKTFTGLAVLLLAEEGRLQLSDPIAAHFPEHLPVQPWLAQTRIDDMLAMVGPHSRTTYVEASDSWLPSYFQVPPTHRPGVLFTYDTSASYVLAALVERLSGLPLLEYLRPRLLEPLGIGENARFLTGPEGISHGGSGLIMAPADLLPIAETINGGGLFDGRRILPERVVARLIERCGDPATQTWGAALRAGYGRQVWLPGGRAWMMFGLGGQIVYGDPDRAIAAVVTADSTPLVGGDQRLADMLLRALAGLDPDAVTAAELVAPAPPHAEENARPVRSDAVLLTGEEAPTELTVEIDGTGGRVQWDAEHDVSFSTLRPTVGRSVLGDAVVTAGWSAAGVLDVQVSVVGDDIATVRLRLVVAADGILTVLAQGYGPMIHPSWTWRGSYRI